MEDHAPDELEPCACCGSAGLATRPTRTSYPATVAGLSFSIEASARTCAQCGENFFNLETMKTPSSRSRPRSVRWAADRRRGALHAQALGLRGATSPGCLDVTGRHRLSRWSARRCPSTRRGRRAGALATSGAAARPTGSSSYTPAATASRPQQPVTVVVK